MKPIEAEKQRRKARVRRDYDKTIDSIRKADIREKYKAKKVDSEVDNK